ncbi:zeta toxin family protein [Streptomyces sp. NPDC046215]|uniref:UDP-N-acetylglucosamine kinase n=1 Tax=Streptomyces stramineus TaxID=173861 RepID=A0ABN1A0C4_9ACTN
MAEAKDFFLSEAELTRIFAAEVRNFVFSGYTPQRDPVLVLLGGQPAAGKSQAMAAAEQRHADRQLVPLTGDELRRFHPRYQELLEKQPLLFPNATGQASGAWVRMSIEHALDNGYSLMLEGIFRDPAMTVATAERFARAGHSVEVIGLAVPEERSRLDSLHRYLAAGRWTPPNAHDLAIRMMPETIAAAEASAAVRRITITNRAADELYVNERGPDGRWRGEPGAVQALTAGRARPLPADEARGWLVRHREVVITFAGRAEIDNTSRPVLHRVTVDAESIAVMADPDPRSALRMAHAGELSVLRTLVSEPPTPDAPLELLPDKELTQLHARLKRGEKAAQRASRPPGQEEAFDVVQRLKDQGASPELIARAQTSAVEDRQYAERRAFTAAARASRLGRLRQQTAAEIQRRGRLPVVQRQAEDGLRQQLQGVLRPARRPRAVPPPGVQAPRSKGPQHPPRGRGQSL